VLRNVLVALEAGGAPYELLEEQSNRHDLLLIGKGADFISTIIPDRRHEAPASLRQSTPIDHLSGAGTKRGQIRRQLP
jgi:hypothetical protein